MRASHLVLLFAAAMASSSTPASAEPGAVAARKAEAGITVEDARAHVEFHTCLLLRPDLCCTHPRPRVPTSTMQAFLGGPG